MTSIIIDEIINLTRQHKDLVELKYFFELQKHEFLSKQQLFDFEAHTKNDSFFIKLEKLLRLFESINPIKLSELKISLEKNTQYSIELDSKLQELETEVIKSYKRQGLNYLEVLNKIQKSFFLTHIFGDYGDIAYKEFSIDGENINYYNSIEGLLLIIENYFKENQITFDKDFFKDFFEIDYYYYYFIYIKDKNEEIENLKIFFSDFIYFSNRIRFLLLLILLKSQLEDFIITILENYNYMPTLSDEELNDKIEEILKEFNIEKPHLTKYQQQQKAFLKEKQKLEDLEIKLQNANISLDIDFENTDIQSFPSDIRPLIISLIQTKTNLRTIIEEANITLDELENLKMNLRKLPNIEYEIPEILNDKRKSFFINLLIEFYKKKLKEEEDGIIIFRLIELLKQKKELELKELNYKLKNTKGNIYERIKIIKERTKLIFHFDNELKLYNDLIRIISIDKFEKDFPIELYTELEHLFNLVKQRIDIYKKEIDKLKLISKHLTNRSSRNSSDSLYGGRKLLKSYKKL